MTDKDDIVWRLQYGFFPDKKALSEAMEEAAATITSLREELAKARKALEPFSKEAAEWSKTWTDQDAIAFHPAGQCCDHCGEDPKCETAKFTVGDLRAAATAMGGENGLG